ncbi:MAG: hypothetical protein P9F75_17830 [Candidatus Contendobacter sp.]|nr:hypothetical protein [Candidatus Contendobacter sp.]
MAKPSIKNSRGWFLTTAAICALTIARCATAAPTLKEVGAGVNIDPAQISVSGISSGGFMAHQFHVAHSENIMGVGIVAGGPYYCAGGSILDAVTKCSEFVVLECTKLGLDPKWCGKTDLAPKDTSAAQAVAQASFGEAQKQEAAGTINKLTGLRNAKVYLFSAEYDAIVPHGVMDAVFHFYADPDKAGIEADNVGYNRTFPARHTMVRDGFNEPADGAVGDCPLPPAPSPPLDKNTFIDDCESVAKRQQAKDGCVCPPPAAGEAARRTICPPADKQTACKDLRDVDLAGAILKRIYGEQVLKGGRVKVAEGEVKAFDQVRIFGMFSDYPFTETQNASMAKEGYVFIPKTCKDGRKCKLHVAFHGCLQGGGATDHRSGQHDSNLFAKFAGYNEWAQANDIIVLYPQVRVWNSGPLNPQGCWDWWGQLYTHDNYHTQGGKQIKAVAQMIDILAGKQLLPIPAQ